MWYGVVIFLSFLRQSKQKTGRPLVNEEIPSMKTEMLAQIIFLTNLRNSVFEKFYFFQNGEVTQLSLWKQKVQVAKIVITVQWRRTLTGQGHPRSRGQRSARRDAMVTMVSTVCLHVIVCRSKEQLKERLSLNDTDETGKRFKLNLQSTK